MQARHLPVAAFQETPFTPDVLRMLRRHIPLAITSDAIDSPREDPRRGIVVQHLFDAGLSEHAHFSIRHLYMHRPPDRPIRRTTPRGETGRACAFRRPSSPVETATR